MRVDRDLEVLHLDSKEAFFAGAWFNLTHELSLDSERAGYLNAVNGCEELLRLFDFGDRFGGPKKRVIVAMELATVLDKDPILQLPVFKSTTGKLIKLLSENNEENSPVNKKTSLVKSLLVEYLELIKEEYVDRSIEEIKRLFENDDFDCFYLTTERLVSTLVSLGFSLNSLYGLYKNVLVRKDLNDEYDFLGQFDIFSSKLKNTVSDYEVQIIFKFPELTSFISEEGIRHGEVELKRVNNQIESKLRVRAKSELEAGECAHEELRKTVDALCFFLSVPSPNVSQVFTARKLDSNNKKKLKIKSNVPNPKYSATQNEYDRFILSLDKVTKDRKLESAFRQMGISTSSKNLETRFIGVWSALESLTRDIPEIGNVSHDDDRVSYSAVPAVAFNYVIKKLKAYISVLSHIDKTDFEVDGNPFSTKNISTVQMLEIICNEEKVNAIIDSIGSYPYLKYRFLEFSKICSSSIALARNIHTHEERVKVQISRLYRVRNILVHDGGNIKNLELLCAHVEHYLLCNLSSIIFIFNNKRSIKTSQEALIRLNDLLIDVKNGMHPHIKKTKKIGADKADDLARGNNYNDSSLLINAIHLLS